MKRWMGVLLACGAALLGCVRTDRDGQAPQRASADSSSRPARSGPTATAAGSRRATSSPEEQLAALFEANQRPARCLSLAPGEVTPRFAEVEVRESHTPPCGGDPLTAPAVGHFRVLVSTGEVEWLDEDGRWQEAARFFVHPAIAFFRLQIRACNAFVAKNDDNLGLPPERLRFDGSANDPTRSVRVVEAAGPGRQRIEDAEGTRLVVDLGRKIITGPEGEKGAMPIAYSPCDPRVFVGAHHD